MENLPHTDYVNQLGSLLPWFTVHFENGARHCIQALDASWAKEFALQSVEQMTKKHRDQLVKVSSVSPGITLYTNDRDFELDEEIRSPGDDEDDD